MPRLLLISLALLLPIAQADTIKVAVAANFTAPMKELAEHFQRATGHTALVSYGSTGKLYAQILHGAPYQVFLAADDKRPAMLYQSGKGREPVTYAVGRLALWSPDPELVDSDGQVLRDAAIDRLAIANPKTAPYGVGALQVLEAIGVKDRLASRLVRGDNIAQTYQFVYTGNVPLGFVAISQVISREGGSSWIPPQSYYEPLRQDAILLTDETPAQAALSFMQFLQSGEAREVIARFGYGNG